MEKSILNEIAEYTKKRYAEVFRRKSLEAVKKEAFSLQKGNFEFEKALKAPGVSFICEIKKASPSKGLISPDFPYLKIAGEYDKNGASAISCLTEPHWFLGSDEYLKEISSSVSIPVLRKDFTLYDYQIYEAKTLGASAVLLICAILDTATISKYIKICDNLGMSAVVEAHDENEIKSAIAAGARIIGVNNRNLHDFSVDINNSTRYRNLIPKDIIFISESGMKTHSDIKVLEDNHTDAALIGETLMRSENRGAKIRELKYGTPKVKICGLRRVEDVEYVNELKPDFAGFILSPGFRRSITKKEAARLSKNILPGIKKVGVFVNDDPDNINSYVSDGMVDLVQLHGSESPEFCKKIKAPVIKMFNCKTKVPDTAGYDTGYYLFDSGSGSGKKFDWRNIPEVSKPYFLAGGINAENVVDALKSVHPFAFDVSSAVETNGFKDKNKIEEFIKRVKDE